MPGSPRKAAYSVSPRFSPSMMRRERLHSGMFPVPFPCASIYPDALIHISWDAWDGRWRLSTTPTRPASGSEVFWHGDYGMRNVLYSESKDRITVIDWSNANWVLEPAEKSNGSPGMDLGVALISLFHQRPLEYMYISRSETLGAAFPQGYQREQGCFRIETVLPFISGLIRLRREYWISQRGILRNLFHDPSLIRLRLFLSRIQPRLQ